jgi:type IV pilus biogenesis protein CpaD/CtpE
MNECKTRNRIHARALIAAALAAVLAGCDAQMSTPSTANLPDPPASDADLPVIVVTAHPLHPDERPEEGVQAVKDQELRMPADVDRSPETTARKARLPSGAPNETG